MPRSHTGIESVSGVLGFSREVLWADECKGTFKYAQTGTGGDDVFVYDTSGSILSTNGIHLVTRTTSAADGDTLRIARMLSFPVSGQLYTRLRMGVGDVSLLELIRVGINFKDGAKEYESGLTYKPNVPSLSYHNSAGGLTAIPTLAWQMGDWQNSILEFGLDVLAKEYLSALWLGTEADLADVAVQEVGVSTLRQLEFSIEIETAGAAAASLFADTVYVGPSQAV